MNPHALELAMRGLRVFPLAPGRKYPSAEGWQQAATNDPIEAFDLVPAGHNVGVATDGLIVIDVDAGKGGLEEFERLKAAGLIPHTFTVRSARGGLHVYLKPRGEERFRSRAYRQIKEKSGAVREVFALEGIRGVDVRANGGLVVGPGSTFEGKPYTVEIEAGIAEIPEGLAELARRAAPRVVAAVDKIVSSVALDDPDSIARATAYLLSAPTAVQNAGGDDQTYRTACRVLDFGVSPETALSLMLEHWDVRCEPEWGAEDLWTKIRNAGAYRQKPIGSDIRDDVFETIEITPAKADELGDLFEFPEDIDLAEIIRDQARDLIRGMLSPADFAVLYGPSGAGKSFIALDLAHKLSRGEEWMGRKTRKCGVVYVSGEGVRGFRRRIKAAEEKLGKFGEGFGRIKVHVPLARNEFGAAGAQKIATAVRLLKAKRGCSEVVVIVDTLARAMAGDDENSTEAMMHFVEARAGAITRETGAAVLVVHHSGKNGNIRGSSALFAAAEFVLRVDVKEGARTLIAEKVKDGEDGILCAYTLRPVYLGVDADGLSVTSCVVEVGASERTRKAGAVALEIIKAAIDRGEALSPSPRARNYAARYVYASQGVYDFSEGDYEAALKELLAGPLAVETVENKGRDVSRIVIRGDASKIGVAFAD